MSTTEATSPFHPLRFEPYRDAHGDGVIAVVTACYAGYDQVIELDTLDDDLPRIPERYPAPHTFRVLLDGDRVVGTVAVKLFPDEGRANLKRVFLLPAFRGRGLGKALVRWAFAWAAAEGAARMTFWSDVLYETAHGLYEKLGCERTGKRHLGGDNDVWEYGYALDLSAVRRTAR